MIKEKEIYERL